MEALKCKCLSDQHNGDCHWNLPSEVLDATLVVANVDVDEHGEPAEEDETEESGGLFLLT